jgi:hypothetical protein
MQSHYQIGYDDGCAGNVVSGHHTSDYKRGYADGQSACSGGGRNPVTQPPIHPRPIPNTAPQPLPPNTRLESPDNEESSTSNDINWEDLCNQGTSLGLIHLAQDCSYYAHGIQLTQGGNQALACLAAGGVLAYFQPGLAVAAQRLLSNTNTICS